MQRSTSNSDFSVRMVEHVPFQTMKIYICTMIDRRNQPRAENVFHVQEVLTKLQSLQLESMRRNFHVKLPYITIDKISCSDRMDENFKVATYSRFNVRHRDGDICIHVLRCLPCSIRYSYAKFISGLFISSIFPILDKIFRNENNLI